MRDYMMKPGDAYLYDPACCTPREREGSTRLLRIEGMNMDKVKRFPYEAVERSGCRTPTPSHGGGMICFSSIT